MAIAKLFALHANKVVSFSCSISIFLIKNPYSNSVQLITTRSSPLEVFIEKGILKICSKFTGEHLCGKAISIKLLCDFIETKLRHECLSENLLLIFRTSFYKNNYEGLLIHQFIWNETVANEMYHQFLLIPSLYSWD